MTAAHKILVACLLMSFMNAAAQSDDPEFRKGWLLNARLTNGVITNFHGNQPDSYAGGLGLNPQVTVVPHLLRAGANISGVYGGKKTSALFGPMMALKLKSLKVGHFGTIANLHLTGEANWGTNKQALAGGGLALEIAKLAHIGLSVQRDYRQSNWWLQSFIAIRLNKLEHEKDPYQ